MPTNTSRLSHCRKCPLYTQGFIQYVPPTIPPGSKYNLLRVMLVGEAPGEKEVEQKHGFMDTSGEELAAYLNLASIPRECLLITNIVRCRPPKNRDPKQEEIDHCSLYMHQLLDTHKPDVIVAIGRFSAHYFLPEFKHKENFMEMCHGVPYRKQNGLVIIPCYHPSFGLRNYTMMTHIAQDFKNVREYLSGTIKARDIEDDTVYKHKLEFEEITSVQQFWASVVFGNVIAVDTESEVVGKNPDPRKDKLWCITYSIDGRRGYMIKKPYLMREFSCCVDKPHRTTVFHNALYDMNVLWHNGIYPAHVEDTMQMAYLLQDMPLKLKVLSYRLLGMPMRSYTSVIGTHGQEKALSYLMDVDEKEWPLPEKEEKIVKGVIKLVQHQTLNKRIDRLLTGLAKKPDLDVCASWLSRASKDEIKQVVKEFGPMPRGTLEDVPHTEALEYACKDAIVTALIYPVLKKRIQDEGLENAYRRDINIMPIVIQMVNNGIMVDKKYFRNLSKVFQEEMDLLCIKASDLYKQKTKKDVVVNPNSPPQISQVLYDMHIFPHQGMSTGEEVLDKYKSRPGAGEIIKCITDYRELKKLKGTYSDALPRLVDTDGRIHTHLSITRTTTGRLASSDPNLMNQPTATELGKKIRAGFIPKKGFVLASFDYSQIEMRLMAHASQDEVMLDAFIFSDADIHSQTASRMFNIPLDKVDKEKHRYPAKRISFGIIYGISEIGLYKQFIAEGIQCTKQHCLDLIKSWFSVYKGVRVFIERVQAEIRRTGRVRNFMGRYRLIPEIRSNQFFIRDAGLRRGVNAPIQGGAAEIIKEAMVKLTPLIEKEDEHIVPLLQIHDELLFEIRKEALDDLKPRIINIMETAIPLSLPTPVDCEIGEFNWRDLK